MASKPQGLPANFYSTAETRSSVLGLSPVGISGDFGSYPESRRFYSLISKQPCGGGASQDYLDLHPQSQFNLLIHRMANDATLPNRGGEMLKAESQC